MPKPYQPYTDGSHSAAWRGEAYRYYIETHYMVGTSHGWPASPAFDYGHPAGPPESPIAWRLTRPNSKGYGHVGFFGKRPQS